VLTLAENVGKAEAIRRGLAHAIDSGASIVGYYDADLATPPSELLRLVDVLDSKSELEFVLAARVRLLGRHIQRHAARHYLGRLFATAASLILQIPVYDTQCGAKVFRTSPAVREAFARPFRSSWVFDVELIGRLLKGSETAAPVPLSAFEEMPLREWRDVPGSRLRLFGMLRAGIDLAVVAPRLSRRGRGLAHRPGNHARSGHS
jgi:glycosyl transferase family 2